MAQQEGRQRKRTTPKDSVERLGDSLPEVHCRYSDMIPTADLIPHPDNYNKHPNDQLIRIGNAIMSNGWRQPIVVSNQSGYIVKGEGRYRAAVLKGWGVVPVEYQDYGSMEQELSDLVADNRAGEGAQADLLKLGEVYEKVARGGVDPSMSMALNNNDLALMEKARRENERMLGTFANDVTGKVSIDRAIPEMELRPFEHHDYIMVLADDMRDFVFLCTVLGVRREQYFTNPNKEDSSRVGVSRVISAKRIIERLESLGIVNRNELPADMEAEDE